mgnify:CR=1 FL=1
MWTLGQRRDTLLQTYALHLKNMLLPFHRRSCVCCREVQPWGLGNNLQ